jgi:hypothetical protein
MISLIAEKYSKVSAFFMLQILCLQFLPAFAKPYNRKALYANSIKVNSPKRIQPKQPQRALVESLSTSSSKVEHPEVQASSAMASGAGKLDGGGPTQPEMTSFQSVGSDNLVNLFTGDFSYNIPLMDVGGYPINLFYDGGVSMEQDASWVGLGWNINPGTVSRNMRGLPDDFNGTEKLKQVQKMKPNVTFGGSFGGDLELFGIKLGKDSSSPFSGSLNLGLSVNNYLGPELSVNLQTGASLQVPIKSLSEIHAGLGANVGLGLNLSSRSALSVSPSASLGFNASKQGIAASTGFSAATSYNSRVGVKTLQISGQLSAYKQGENDKNPYRASNSTSLSFTRPSYIPSIRLPVTNTAWTGRFQVGAGMFGNFPSFQVEVYQQKSAIEPEDEIQEKPMVGYLHYQNSKGNENAVMDFTRFNDGEVTPNTPIISVPQYTYDIFTIQGEGTGGSIRAYRNDQGYVRDNKTTSKDKSLSMGADIGTPGHFGANANSIQTPSTIGEWVLGNKLKGVQQFQASGNGNESVYLKNPGETSVLDDQIYAGIGGVNLVRYQLGGTSRTPTIEAALESFDKKNAKIGNVSNPALTNTRKKRTQVISFLTAYEASQVGLEKEIRSYHPSLDANNSSLSWTPIPRVDQQVRLSHHISQVNVTEANGKRYVYGIPVYNLDQVDFTFSVSNPGDESDEVSVTMNDLVNLKTERKKDGYLQTTTTPPYAHAYLLTGLLSSDYVDVTDDGITEDDLGSAVKFNYTRTSEHAWRTPLAAGKANFNAGMLTETKDDKGIISWGKRESWYVHSIESKTMIALFTLEDRHDGKGTQSYVGGASSLDNAQKKLKRIDLYNKSDLKNNGINQAKPIKTVFFEYDYSLCDNSRDNDQSNDPSNANKGKLTLTGIYFTFNGKLRTNRNQYAFSYGVEGKNIAYAVNASDRWGNYKPKTLNPSSSLKNSEFPYAVQDAAKKAEIDQNAAPWSLTSILLPSGGQIEVEYESDDYAYVQNKRAASMMKIAGFGKEATSFSNTLYSTSGLNVTEHPYVSVWVADPCNNRQEVFEKYLSGQQQLVFKLAVKMPNKKYEYVTSYAEYEDYGVVAGNPNRIWVKLKTTDGISPMSLSAVEFLREHLPGQAYPGYDINESTPLRQAAEMLAGMMSGLKNSFQNPLNFLRREGKAKSVDLEKSFVRLNEPDGIKYGGGYRVKSVKMVDNWSSMTGQHRSIYGKSYDYTTTEHFNGAERVISSGVASYEPTIGGEENPFQTIVQVSNKLPLGPASYGAVEMPVLDAFFPFPVVGYGKVTVRSLKKNIDPDKKFRSNVGKQVTEYYTAKDFPVQYSHTSLDPSSDKQVHNNIIQSPFSTYVLDMRAISQGFLIETNDMHGKMKSRSSYAENDLNTRVHYTEYFYRNTGKNGLNEKFQFVFANEGGKIKEGNMGIDVELMTDVREFSTKSNSLDIQGQIENIGIPGVSWIPFIWFIMTKTENTYRAITTTKVVNYHSVVDRVIVIDKGSQVSTENLVYDSETGNVVVSRTNNEFDQPIYSVNYPAYWAYEGMGLAYKNIDAAFANLNFLDGKITNSSNVLSMIESGDELIITKEGSLIANCPNELSSSSAIRSIWAFDKNKYVTPSGGQNPDFIFMDKYGNMYNRNNVSVRIIRSGKRNMLDASVQNFTSLSDPRLVRDNDVFLDINYDSKVINASAIEFKEKWQTDRDIVRRVKLVRNASVELLPNGNFSQGNTGFHSQYGYAPAQSNGGNEGNYTIGTNPMSWNTDGFQDCRDHTSGGGLMLMLNGAGDQRTAWQQQIQVLPNTNYIFSGWAQRISGTNPATLKFLINDAELGGTLTLNASNFNWTYFSILWNSGSVTHANLEIKNINTSANGNDFALDDLSFRLENDCGLPLAEQEDCNGELTKRINPYTKGLIGNFRSDRSYTFYGARLENDPTIPTNIKRDGALKDFGLYWVFNGSKLLPTTQTGNWTWNSQITRLNAKGQELETKDALDIYTSAQYGYGKSMPVAITSNSSYHEMFFAGMEERGYNESIHTSSNLSTCGSSHIELPSTELLTAHTGRSVLAVGAGTQYEKSISGFATSVYEFPMSLASDIVKPLNLNDNGSIVEQFSSNNSNGAIHVSETNASIFKNYFKVYSRGIQVAADLSYNFNGSQYVNIITEGTYKFRVNFSSQTVTPYGSSLISHTYSNLNIYDTKGIKIDATLTASSYSNTNASGYIEVTAKLCLGVYKVVLGGNATHQDPQPSASIIVEDFYDLECINAQLPFYKSLSEQNGCTYTKPMEANPAMLNPVFSVPSGKKMLLSAWVKESCLPAGTVSCSTYLNSSIKVMQAGNGLEIVNLRPSGPIIEGWQKIEGEFTTPANGTGISLVFVNGSSSANHFDDIRVHPYHANMKSYVYDPITLRLTAELDANNYATFYEYDEEGTLIRVKKETKEGVKTIKETRSFQQTIIKTKQ